MSKAYPFGPELTEAQQAYLTKQAPQTLPGAETGKGERSLSELKELFGKKLTEAQLAYLSSGPQLSKKLPNPETGTGEEIPAEDKPAAPPAPTSGSASPEQVLPRSATLVHCLNDAVFMM